MIYKSYVIVISERAPARWIARISRVDGKNIQAEGGWENSFYDTVATVSAAEAEKYARAAIDSRQIR
jgi:hypothetical protein